MYNHEPDGYSCPFCRRTSLDMGLGSGIHHTDIVFDNGTVTAFLAAIQRNPNDGSALVIPNNNYENIYDMPVDLLAQNQGDNFYADYENGKRVMPAEERAGHAKHLREQLSNWRSTLAERLA